MSEDDPYRLLGVPYGADEEALRSAYRKLLRKHRPERDPEGFARLRAAYDRVLQDAAWLYVSNAAETANDAEDSPEADDLPERPSSRADEHARTNRTASELDREAAPPVDSTAPSTTDDEEAEPDPATHSSEDSWGEPSDDLEEEDDDEFEEEDDDEFEFDDEEEDDPTVEVSDEAIAAVFATIADEPDYDAAGSRFDALAGDLRFRAPQAIAIRLAQATIEHEPSEQALEHLVHWIEKLDDTHDWALDFLQARLSLKALAKEADEAVEQGIPPDIARILVDHFDMPIFAIAAMAQAVFEADDYRQHRRWLRKLRKRHPSLWQSWQTLRGQLVDATDSPRLIGDTSIDGSEARRRAWELMRSMDKSINDGSDLPTIIGAGVAIALVSIAWRIGGGWWVLVAIPIGLVILFAAVEAGWRRAFYTVVTPRLDDELEAQGLTVADIAAVLIERPNDFKHWDEVENEMNRAIPFWLASL